MPRKPRCVLPEVAYHVTQRGVNRSDVFFSHQDRATYLNLVQDHRQDAGVRILGWCLMTNHVHWVVVPDSADSLAVLFRRVHGRYAQYLNVRKGRSGHVWQNRYFSCPVSAAQEENVLRYVEWNPVRAGMVNVPEEYQWSSAAAHLIGPQAERGVLLDWTYWRNMGGAEAWKRRLELVEDVRDAQRIRRATFAGSPLGSECFVAEIEAVFGRHWRKPGRPKQDPSIKGKLKKGTEQAASVLVG